MNAKAIQATLEAAAGHHRAGRLEQAAALYEKVLAQDTKNADALHLSGLIAYQRGDFMSAAGLILRAIAANPHDASYRYHLGVVHTAAGSLDDAVSAYRRAIRLRPDYAEAYNNLGLILARQGRDEEAEDCYEDALKLRADFADALLNLGNLHKDRGDLDQAQACYKKVLASNPNHAGAYNNLGNLKLRRENLDEAMECYRRSISLNPGDADPVNNLGGILMRLGAHDEALRLFDQAIALAPGHPGAHLNKAWLLLLTGRFAEGWKEYEWRLKFEEQGGIGHWLAGQLFPTWNGSPAAGRTILVYCEQGLGDTIQFVRYLPLLRKTGARIVFCCQKELLSLLRTAPGIDSLIVEPPGGEVAAAFDCHVPLLSLPGLLDPNLAAMTAGAPYLFPESDKLREWESRLNGPGFKVGIVWAGRPANKEDWRRSCRLEDFSGIAAIPGVSLFSLQKGAAASEALSPPSGMNLIDLGPLLADFADTAAAIMNLDLVIAVDTAVAHLAGALGSPVWTLLPFFPDWRWMLGREDSPWYPTMRLFRQTRTGDWQSVFDRVTAELTGKIADTETDR